LKVKTFLFYKKVTIGFIAVLFHFGDSKKAWYYGLVSCTMTVSKTVLYFMMDKVAGNVFTGHNNWNDFLLMYVLPSSFWIVLPSIVIYMIFNRISYEIDLSSNKDGKKKK
jgi:hypothetical protein